MLQIFLTARLIERIYASQIKERADLTGNLLMKSRRVGRDQGGVHFLIAAAEDSETVWMQSVNDWAKLVLHVSTAERIIVFAVIFWAVASLYGETCDQWHLCV